MTQSTGNSSLRPWNDLFLLCRRESDRVCVCDSGFPYIVANPPSKGGCATESGQDDTVSTPAAANQAGLA